ncbi:MAG: MmgE/PrpD family protein [Candidatus Dormibacter sp.]|uniref:MmgE/PrpD family protein n=1 Tax=Candidatus Dormibacter sp. TaxID=2973982 RepID=UPI000DB8DFAB|nr:MAG: 2-methylcitrate dehydratase [Candidatus Dormibacteraeota bacterium]
MTMVQELARFAGRARWEDVSRASQEALKKRVLDALGCAYGALEAPPIRAIREHTLDFGGSPLSTLIGGGRTSPDRAAFQNGAAVRYLDFNDTFLGRGEACHPSDNLAPVLAAAEYIGASGKEMLAGLAVAYQVQLRLSQVAPVRAHGFDHSTQGAYAASAGVARALGLDADKTANAIAICGTAFNALRVTRTGSLSNWKALAYPNVALGAIHAGFLARRGVTGPMEVLEGSKGFMEAIAGRFELDWSREDLEAVQLTIIKRYNAEGHAQSTIDAVLELRRDGLRAEEVERIDLQVFDVSYEIIGPGAGDKKTVRTKEEADHSLPYLVASALLDGEMTPAQYAEDRVNREDVQALLQKVDVHEAPELSKAFPEHQGVRIEIRRHDGRTSSLALPDYQGPCSWQELEAKFTALGGPPQLVDLIQRLDELPVSALAEEL